MQDFYQKIQDTEMSSERRVYTCLEPPYLGEKVYLADGKIQWLSRKDGFFAKHLKSICEYDADFPGMDIPNSGVQGGIVQVAGREVFCDRLGNEKHIVICGAGHVSLPVIQLGVMIGCKVTVLEDRPQFADAARRAGATKIICDSFENGLMQITGNKDTFFVIVTRGHRYDKICLERIAIKKHAYIGMIGSRKRTALVKQALLEKGVNKEILEKVYTPIGLDIKAETPVEIAIAIIAEIIEVKNRQTRTGGYSKELIKEILGNSQLKVLGTIVRRRGSAPRGVGTKMLVKQDGTIVGTIGGGYLESAVIRKAQWILNERYPSTQVFQVDLSGAVAEEEGMVCGGKVDILMELIPSQ